MAKDKLLQHSGPGAQSFDIKYSDFVKGMGTNDYANDGGFSPNSIVNPIVNPGAIYAPAASTTRAAGLSVTPIASCEEATLNGNVRYFLAVDNSGVGYFYKLDGGYNFTLQQTDSTSNRTYTLQSSDMVTYAGRIFATSEAIPDIINWDGTSTSGTSHFDPTWWTSTMGKSIGSGIPHPMIVFNNTLYIANGNTLMSWDGSTATQAVLTLSSGLVITALGIDPASGKMLIAVMNRSSNPDNAYAVVPYIGLYDGFNPTQFVKKIFVDEQVDSFYNVGGTVYCGYGKNFGYFTGTGIKFLFRLKNVGYSRNDLLYKAHITNISNNLYFIDGNLICCYGEILHDNFADKNFYYVKSGLGNFSIVTNVGSGLLAMFDPTTQALTTFDVYGAPGSSAQGTFYSNSIYLPRLAYVRAIDVYLTSNISSGSHTIGVVDDQGVLNPVGVFDSSLTSGKYARLYAGDIKTSTIQVRDGISGSAGIAKMIVYYDFAE